jgi:hypothetical protein
MMAPCSIAPSVLFSVLLLRGLHGPGAQSLAPCRLCAEEGSTMSTIDAEAFVYLGELGETASQMSNLLQEAYKSLGAAEALYENSRWLTDGGDLKIYDDHVGIQLILRKIGYLANSMGDLDGSLSVVLEAARGTDAVYEAANDTVRELRQTHDVAIHA